ncbi:MAG: aldo/keto reductase family protein [Myxococcaceae bacterium]|nr:aldo/keto reductase family protein [Myxococcaceae bacterium]MCI0669752.1 aldo/keto reductase family protein [Myxococcaceae bacterium]
MHYRRLGTSGLMVSEVSLGTYLTVGHKLEDTATLSCVFRAFELGINLFDTADSYGNGRSEEVLGRALRALGRNRCVVATKCFLPVSEDPNGRGLSRKHIVESVHASLRRLQTDHVDLMQCHRFDPDVPLEETVEALSDLRRQGKLLYWGVSRWTGEQLRKAHAIARGSGGASPVSNQLPYHALFREIVQEVLPACSDLGVGVLAYAPLAQGVLTGKYTHGIPEGSRADVLRDAPMHQLRPPDVAAAARAAALAQELGCTPAQLALAWVLRTSTVSSAIVGASRPEQLDENVKAAGLRFPEDVWSAFEQRLSGEGGRTGADRVFPAR